MWDLKTRFVWFIYPNCVGSIACFQWKHWQGSFHFLLQNERIGLVRSKTSWNWAENELCLWSACISWRKHSFSEMSIFSLFSGWKRSLYKFGHRTQKRWYLLVLDEIKLGVVLKYWDCVEDEISWFSPSPPPPARPLSCSRQLLLCTSLVQCRLRKKIFYVRISTIT